MKNVNFKDISSKEVVVSWICQIIIAVVLAKASLSKFMDDEMTILVFKTLKGMESTRFVIATIEALAAFLLLTKTLPHYGALLGLGTMMGAFIAHSTVLGFTSNKELMMMSILMLFVTALSFVVIWINRKRFPFIGQTF